jgi:hypothetical protein
MRRKLCLLRDFVEAMLELSQGGIEMFLHGSMHKIEGLFVYVPADTLFMKGIIP